MVFGLTLGVPFTLGPINSKNKFLFNKLYSICHASTWFFVCLHVALSCLIKGWNITVCVRHGTALCPFRGCNMWEVALQLDRLPVSPTLSERSKTLDLLKIHGICKWKNTLFVHFLGNFELTSLILCSMLWSRIPSEEHPRDNIRQH